MGLRSDGACAGRGLSVRRLVSQLAYARFAGHCSGSWAAGLRILVMVRRGMFSGSTPAFSGKQEEQETPPVSSPRSARRLEAQMGNLPFAGVLVYRVGKASIV